MPFRLTKEQRITAVKFYYKLGDNAAETSRYLSREYGIREVQGRNIKQLVDKFEETGSVCDTVRSGRPTTATTDEMGDHLVENVNQSPQKSIRRLSAELNVSKSSVQRLLKKLNMKPYIPRLVHGLSDGDQDRRVEFAETFLEMVDRDASLVDRIWWSDEAMFKLNGQINRHNCVYWAIENPRMVCERFVSQRGVTVWAAISSQGIIGPFFFDDTVNGENYLDMLKTQFWPTVRRPRNVYFQQDGAPPHYSLAVRNWLDQKFPGRWFGRRGPIEWPARSPDMTPPDFFLWGVMKDLVYRERPGTMDDLKQTIRDKFATLDEELCAKVCRSVPERLRNCILYEGEQFEFYD